MTVRRMLPFILLNIVVSAVVVLAILFWWDSRQPADEGIAAAPQAAPTQAVVFVPTEPPADLTAQNEAGESASPETYTVQAGDTLGTISQQFGVDMDLIMEANGLDNPNFLTAGQQLIIPGEDGQLPAEEADQASATPTSGPSVVPTPIEAALPTDGEAIVEIGRVLAPGSVLDEAVVLRNTGERPLALLGWRLQDEAGFTYTFGQVTLFGEGAEILVHTRQGQEGAGDLFWGLDEAVWSPGETVTLLDAQGDVRASYAVDGS